MADREKQEVNLEMAEALDGMGKSLSSANADFLAEVLKRLKAADELTPKEEAKLEALYNRYFGEEDEEEEGIKDADDIDEDDFV